MVSTRLTSGIRDQIERALIDHRFSGEEEHVKNLYDELTNDVYNDVYPETVLERMRELPKGWLPTSSTLQIKFGDSFASIQFADGQRRIYDKHCRNAAKIYGHEHQFTERLDSYRSRKAKLGNDKRYLSREVHVMLQSFTTIGKLVEIWPEVAPFAAKFVVVAPAVPALLIQNLTERLGLKTEVA